MNKEIEVKEEKWFEPKGELMVDVWQDNESIVIEAPIAGVDKENLEIVVKNNVLAISGEREARRTEEKDYLLTECYWGAFSKEISLPVEIDKEGIEANIEGSILTVRLPKKEAQEEVQQTVEIK